MQATLSLVREYHRISKHGKNAYAPAPGFLDWDSQPQAFRHFVGAQRFSLPLTESGNTPLYGDLAHGKLPIPAEPGLDGLGAMLELAFGISAWKSMGPARWALRNNPSSGNLHPSEVYLILWRVVDPLSPGLYHYSSYSHCLEQLALISEQEAAQMSRSFTSSFGALALSSVHWREEWKYGVRALRYCQHDAGHALAAATVAATTQGWSLCLEEQISDQTLRALLGLDRIPNEPEHPDWIALLSPDGDYQPPMQTEASWRRLAGALTERNGIASRLSEEFIQWPQIRKVLPALEKPETVRLDRNPKSPSKAPYPPANAAQLIRQRRSAQRMNAEIGMRRVDFQRCLEAVLPDRRLPFAAFPYRPSIHLLLFVHDVEGLAPGIYAFIRNEADLNRLRQCCNTPGLCWEPVAKPPDSAPLPLYWLKAVDEQRKLVSQLCCHQGIAGKSAFSLGMLADFGILKEEGPWAYRRLFWEAGMIGQMLYLEAELSGLRGTGIGCYFDDAVHGLLGLDPEGDWQSLYHFTVGASGEDSRLDTEPAYAHLDNEGR